MQQPFTTTRITHRLIAVLLTIGQKTTGLVLIRGFGLQFIFAP